MFVYKEPTDSPILNTDRDSADVKSSSYITGDRMSTFMIYLSQVAVDWWTAYQINTNIVMIKSEKKLVQNYMWLLILGS